MAQPQQTEELCLGDGSSMVIARAPKLDDTTWADVKRYLEDNPELARSMQKIAHNPEALHGGLLLQAFAEHYSSQLVEADVPVMDRMQMLEQDPDLSSICADIKNNGPEAAWKHYQDEELMVRIGRKMGSGREDLAHAQKKHATLHQAATAGDLKAVQEFLTKPHPLDAQDAEGITALGYAIGSNRISVAKLLLDRRATPFAVDSSGNSALHYAAGYGRLELLEYLLKVGASVKQCNAQGQTPLTVAKLNDQQQTIKVLQAQGRV